MADTKNLWTVKHHLDSFVGNFASMLAPECRDTDVQLVLARHAAKTLFGEMERLLAESNGKLPAAERVTKKEDVVGAHATHSLMQPVRLPPDLCKKLDAPAVGVFRMSGYADGTTMSVAANIYSGIPGAEGSFIVLGATKPGVFVMDFSQNGNRDPEIGDMDAFLNIVNVAGCVTDEIWTDFWNGRGYSTYRTRAMRKVKGYKRREFELWDRDGRRYK